MSMSFSVISVDCYGITTSNNKCGRGRVEKRVESAYNTLFRKDEASVWVYLIIARPGRE